MTHISTLIITFKKVSISALHFKADSRKSNIGAIFTHGYTTSKHDILTWGFKMAQMGIDTILFDLPGHYLGSFNDVESISHFREVVHSIYLECFNHLNQPQTLLIGGHSLGAITTLDILNTTLLPTNPIAFIVGMGDMRHHSNNLFTAPRYKNFLELRSQLVSKALAPEFVHQYITNILEGLRLTGHSFIFISGKDDELIDPKRVEKLAETLLTLGNTVHLELPEHLPHDQPEKAFVHIQKTLSKLKIL